MLPLVMTMATFFRYAYFLCVILSKEGMCRGPHSRSINFSDKWHRIAELFVLVRVILGEYWFVSAESGFTGQRIGPWALQC